MSQQSTERNSCLSVQERRVLQLVAKALSNKEIAAMMGISPSTVKRHVENMFRKLHVKNRIEAAVYAVRTGTSESEPPQTTNSKQHHSPNSE